MSTLSQEKGKSFASLLSFFPGLDNKKTTVRRWTATACHATLSETEDGGRMTEDRKSKALRAWEKTFFCPLSSCPLIDSARHFSLKPKLS